MILTDKQKELFNKISQYSNEDVNVVINAFKQKEYNLEMLEILQKKQQRNNEQIEKLKGELNEFQ